MEVCKHDQVVFCMWLLIDSLRIEGWGLLFTQKRILHWRHLWQWLKLRCYRLVPRFVVVSPWKECRHSIMVCQLIFWGNASLEIDFHDLQYFYHHTGVSPQFVKKKSVSKLDSLHFFMCFPWESMQNNANSARICISSILQSTFCINSLQKRVDLGHVSASFWFTQGVSSIQSEYGIQSLFS